MWKRVLLITFACLADAKAGTDREQELEHRVELLERRLAALEARFGAAAEKATAADSRAATPSTAAEPGSPVLAGGLTISGYFDGNYTWNFARPHNRINLLRAYDVLHNNFSINQTGLVIERAVDASAGRRFGLRLDLMYGQATETLQGGGQNEPRPQVYRPVFQAYGSYLAPVGNGLRLDFGKFAGSLGYEGNYTKDQLTYSRAYFFNFLPFYHMGLRSSYSLHDRLSVTHWLVNGAQQTEDFNPFKSNAFLVNIKPARTLSWNINYYFGREGRAFEPIYNPGLPTVPSQPGLPVASIRPAPSGRFHVLDSYASWQVHARLTLVGEAAYVINRTESTSAPSRAIGGAAYAAYRFHPAWMVATRFEYLDDRHGLFSGVSQALKENTVAVTYEPRPGVQLKGEWRRDYSNRRFFLTSVPDAPSSRQSSATLGLIWWFGKDGSW